MNTEHEAYNKEVIKRVLLIMEIVDLTVDGFAAFVEREPSHIYGVLNGSRSLSESLALKIGKRLGFNGAKIFKLSSEMPSNISKSDILIQFKKDNKENLKYFQSSATERSINAFILEILLKEGFLKEPQYLRDIEIYSKDILKRTFVGDQLSKALRYAVKVGKLKSKKAPIKLKDGGFGTRQVDVYYL